MTGCSYCDNSGRVPGDADMGRYDMACPACYLEDDLDSYKMKALMLAVRAVGDALAERAIAAMRCDCGQPLDVPASMCSSCFQADTRRAQMSVVPD